MPSSKEYLSIPVFLDEYCQVVCYLHILQHRCEKDKEFDELRPSNRTLFIAGLPYGILEKELRIIFSAFGEVDDVLLSTVGGIKVAHVIYEAPQGVKKALISAKKGIQAPLRAREEAASDSTCAPLPETGIKKWIAEHVAMRPGNDILRKQVDTWMAGWEKEQERQKAEAAAEIEAEEGWTVVKGRKKSVSGTGVVVGGLAKKKAEAMGTRMGKEKAKLDDFYRFQRREKNRSELLVLREKFEEDKKKVAKLKAARKFKPY
mmetsp:Transcript_26586/g.36714  ORF Transcript_26586/g.36714 Transcript_26586/m.36714 type:complete len:261 (-) Transcript_26586:3-785(-)